jgi:hypothetical protein
MGHRRRQHAYRAVRIDARRWDLEIDGEKHSSHLGYREAERAGRVHDRKRRTRATFIRHMLILAVACLLLAPVLLLREGSNPDFSPAREFADRMEQAYRDVDSGAVDIASFSMESHGFEGAVFEVDRGGVVSDYRVLTGEHKGDCYVVRWVLGEVPFVARLLSRYPCVPGDPALSFDPARFEAIAINIDADGPLEWVPVLPEEVALAKWFFPVAFVLLFVVLQQLVSLSLLAIRGVPVRSVEVARVENRPQGQRQTSTTSG